MERSQRFQAAEPFPVCDNKKGGQKITAAKKTNHGLAPRILHSMTNKLYHHNRNGHVAHNFFNCGVKIPSLAKVTGMQS